MRLPILTLTALAALFVATDAGAQTYDPRYPVCSFTSLPQCRATASGRSASCDLNPYYAFNEPPPPRRRPKRDH